jgi:tetratricopeptide (TPR) repeat protein
VGRLALSELPLGTVVVERLELEVAELGTDPGNTVAERYQRRRTGLRKLVVRVPTAVLEERVETARRHLAGLGITAVHARLADGFASIRARAADGLATADVSFRVVLASSGTHLRALASHIRVHGHLPTPGPVLADRILVALSGATDAPGATERPSARGLCDVELDVVGALLWQLMPPAGWRLPAIGDIELVHVRATRSAIEIAFGPTGTRTGDVGIRPLTLQLAAAHDLMHSVDQQLRSGHTEDAMRGYRALLAAGGPEQPNLLDRILALASTRPAWFFDGLELARQALHRWPQFPAAHAALASITLAQGDAREAAGHLGQLAQLASADGDDDQATLAALAGARLLRVLEPKAATQLYELALEHDPSSTEAADALADRLADEQRWTELVRLLRSRAVDAERERAVPLRLRLADVLVHQVGDRAAAQHELAAARDLAPDDPAVHEMTARILSSIDPPAAISAWREVARIAESRGDLRTAARAFATLGEQLATTPAQQPDAEAAWRRALELDALQADAIAGLASAAAATGAHEAAAEMYERLRGLGLSQQIAARHELALARSLRHLGRGDDARAALRRALIAGGEIAAEAHAMLAEIAEATSDREHAAAELDTAIGALVGLADEVIDSNRLYTRAAELALARASLFDKTGAPAQATADYERAHELAATHAPELARGAARTMLARSPDAITERRWIDAVLATRPPAGERADLLVRRADVRRREKTPDLAAAVADLHEALALVDGPATNAADAAATRRAAYQLEADLMAKSGDQRARAQALAALARMSERAADRVEVETAAAAAWLAADEPAAALPHGARAHAELVPDVPAALRREVLTTLGEAAWRQRAWPDVIRAYRGLVDDDGADQARIGTFRYRLAVAADRSGETGLATSALRPLVDDDAIARATTPDVRGQALRLFADLAERAGDLGGAASALEGFASLADGAAASARADAMYRAGELFRRADRPDDAVRCLEGALRISDTHLPALDALEHAWRERGDLERVSVILGRKVAATARHPQRQKPLLSRLGDLQDQLGRPDVALATHQRALEIDPAWRPSLRYATSRLVKAGAISAAIGGLAQLAGELGSDPGLEAQVVAKERVAAAVELGELVAALDTDALDVARGVSGPVLERAAAAGLDVGAALARLRGEPVPQVHDREEVTPSGRVKDAPTGALSLRDAANRALTAGKPEEAFAALEAANHVSPGDREVLRQLVDLATELDDQEAAARHLAALAEEEAGARKGDVLLQLADIYYDKLEDALRARVTMRAAADAYGPGTRRDAALRMLASESSAHLAWDIAVEAIEGIVPSRRTAQDLVLLGTALARAGKLQEAVRLVENAIAAHRLGDGGELLGELKVELERKVALARALEEKADVVPAPEAEELREEARALRAAAGRPEQPSVTITGSPAETATAVAAAAASADRERLLAAQRDSPEDPAVLNALLAHLADREPALRKQVIDRVAEDSSGRAQAIALHELALEARANFKDPIRASALWTKAHRVDPSYAPVWMPLADALAASDELELARELYEQISKSSEYDPQRRTWAAEQAEALGRDESIISGEIGGPRPKPARDARSAEADLERARQLAEGEHWEAAIQTAERVAEERPGDPAALELLEQLYFESGDITAASEAIGRQLVLTDDAAARATLWRRRAKLYRDALGRDAEAYRCLKEAHACAPADAEIAYQLRTAAMVRGEWALVASLLYREIAGATSPRERGALHFELALIFEEKLGDSAQAQVNYEQALAFDPSIPAARAPLAKRYEAVERFGDAARLYEEAATAARAADRASLLAAAKRCRAAIMASSGENELVTQLERAEAAGDLSAAVAIGHQLWRSDPGNAAAFRVLAHENAMQGDLAALTELTTVRASRATSGDERANAWLDVARLAEETDKPTEAARAYDLALIEDPGHVRALDARGALAFRLGDWATADLIYRDLSPSESVLEPDELALRRSIVAEQLGRNREALTLAQDAVTASPGQRDLVRRVQELAFRIGDLPTALSAAHQVLELVPLDDDEALLATRFSLIGLYRTAGNLDSAVVQLEQIVRDHPHNASALEQLADVYIAKGDWKVATRYLFQLVPLAPNPAARADRLYRLGEAVLIHLGDVDRADDVFLRASDLDPTHVPTLRRLLDVYWRADDPAALVEVATELARSHSLSPIATSSLAQALVAASLIGDTKLATELAAALGADLPTRLTAALVELESRSGRLELKTASTAITELGRRGVVDLAQLRAAASGTPIESALADA